MTVQELITYLQSIEDKTQPVCLFDDDVGLFYEFHSYGTHEEREYWDGFQRTGNFVGFQA